MFPLGITEDGSSPMTASTLQLLAAFCSAPNVGLTGKGLSGFWGSGGTVAADSSGVLYAATADGVFDADLGGSDYGDTVIKLGLNFDSSTSTYAFQVLDYFSPSDQDCRYQNDDDLGSGAPMILPTQLGLNPNLMLMAGKGYPCDGTISPVYLINKDSPGQSSGNVIQSVDGPLGGYWGGGAYLAERHLHLCLLLRAKQRNHRSGGRRKNLNGVG